MQPEVVAVGDSVAQPLDVSTQPGEIRCADEYVVGVDDPDVGAVTLGEG
jgi:hypothetical protein